MMFDILFKGADNGRDVLVELETDQFYLIFELAKELERLNPFEDQ